MSEAEEKASSGCSCFCVAKGVGAGVAVVAVVAVVAGVHNSRVPARVDLAVWLPVKKARNDAYHHFLDDMRIEI